MTASFAMSDETEVPLALLGQGEPPSGTTLNYFEDAQGYLAEPSGEPPFGSVILIHEWNGLVDRVKQVADLLAAQGYVALAADLYSGKIGSNPMENRQLVTSSLADPQKIIDNLNAAASLLRERDDTNGLVATIGWCYGGGVALSYALGGEHHDGTAIFYGRLVTDPEQLATLDHEIFGTFAANDRGIPLADVEKFVAALRASGIENDIHIYDEVAHGFWLYVERDEAVNREPAAHTWGRLLKYFERTIGR
ncbi:MAG: dienelactone hydrolase family protein [Gammaproteobacteria bacterium]|nr:dienelactone hydrolase family protein [Gammaproteobacteria bacterium]